MLKVLNPVLGNARLGINGIAEGARFPAYTRPLVTDSPKYLVRTCCWRSVDRRVSRMPVGREFAEVIKTTDTIPCWCLVCNWVAELFATYLIPSLRDGAMDFVCSYVRFGSPKD